MSRDVLKEATFSLLKSAVSGVSFETSNFLTLDKYVKIRILAALNVIYTAEAMGLLIFTHINVHRVERPFTAVKLEVKP